MTSCLQPALQLVVVGVVEMFITDESEIFFFLVVFISTCLVTVTPQCILFSEMVKKDSKVKLQIGDTL